MRTLHALLVLLFGMLAACAGETAAARPCSERLFEDDRFTVCTFDPEAQALRLAWRGADGEAYRGFDALARGMDQKHVAFAMNAGMFDQVGAPIGLLVESGRELHAISTTEGPGNFHLRPNGVFWIDDAGAPHVTATDSYLALKTSPEWATQSGPMLLIDGTLHPAFDNDGVSRHFRNGVGVGDGGEAWFVISEQPVSFGKLARFFRDSLAAHNALYLDGAVSSLWDPRAGRMDKGVPLGPLVVVCSPSC